MKMRMVLVFLFLLLLLVRGFCFGEVMTLDQCITTALENNLDIKQQQLLLDISTYQERAVRALFYPTLSVLGTDLYLKDVPITSRYSGVVLKQTFYTGGKLTNDLKASQENRNASLYNLYMTQLALENRVFHEYMNCIRFWKFCRAYTDALERADGWIGQVRREISAGRRGEEDFLRWQVLIDSFRARQVEAQKNLDNSKVRLNTLMNRDACTPIEVTDSHNLRFEYADFMIRQKIFTSDQMLEMYYDYALVFSPAYKKKQTEMLIAGYNLNSVKATVLPTIDILSNYSGRSAPLSGVYSTWDAGLYVNFDLYRQQKYENIKISALHLELSRVQEQQYLRDLRADVRTLYNSNASNNEKVSLQRRQQKTSRQYLQEIKPRYEVEKASNLDVVEAFDSFYSNQVALVDSIYNAFSEYASLLNLIGFSFLYSKPAPNIFWRYREHGLNVDFDLKSLDDPTFRFLDEPDFEKVKSTFKGNPRLFTMQDPTGQTALHYAADRGYVNAMELILKNGGTPDALNYLDGTPLVRAICFCPPEQNLAAVELLIKYGANVNRISHHYTPLNWAAMKNKLDLVKALVQAGAEINACDEYMKNTPLHFSAFWGNVEMAQYLMEKGADITLENSDELTPYDLAWQFEHMDMVQFFESLKPRKVK